MHSRPSFSRETISTFQSQLLTYNPNEKTIIITVSIISKIKKHFFPNKELAIRIYFL